MSGGCVVTDLSRHEIDMDIARSQVDRQARLLSLSRDNLLKVPGNLGTMITIAQDYASYLMVVDPTSPQVDYALRVAVQAVLGVFARACATEGTVPITIGDDPPVELPARGPHDYANIVKWRTGFYLALLRRDAGAVDALCRVPSSVIRSSPTKADESAYLFADALQALWLDSPDAADRLKAAVDATEPSRIEHASDHVLNVLVPEMELVYRFAVRDADAFNEALRYALERHKKYWGTKKLRLDARGFVAWGPLALAGLAHDEGMDITVESDYLPQRLYAAT